MRDKAVAGLLFILGLMLIVTGFPGTVGDLLAAVFAPEALVFPEAAKSTPAPADNGGGTSGGF